MLRALHLMRVAPAAVFPFFENRNEFDKIQYGTEKGPLTGRDRLQQMYNKDEMGEISVELHSVVQASMVGAFSGAALGGLVRGREAYLYFIENNQATIFKTTFQAKKKLQDYVTIAFSKGAVYWGWRLGLFTGIFSLVSTTMSVYRGETSLIDYVVGGVLTGGLYKLNLGLAATLVGAGLGGVLSLIGGGVIMLILKVTGVSMADIRRALHKLKEARDNQHHEALEKTANIKHDELTKHHDILVERVGVKKVEEI